MIYSTHYQSPLGKIMLASDGENITGLWLKGQKYYAASIGKNMSEKSDLPVFNAAKKWLDKYFAGKNPNPTDLPLAPKGSNFREAVWKILLQIPTGSVLTYGDIAKKIAKQKGASTMSAQAVGGAVGHNPISIIIPCHRVVGTNGSLTGYAGGIDKKIWLLEHEGADMAKLFKPKKSTAL